MVGKWAIPVHVGWKYNLQVICVLFVLLACLLGVTSCEMRVAESGRRLRNIQNSQRMLLELSAAISDWELSNPNAEIEKIKDFEDLQKVLSSAGYTDRNFNRFFIWDESRNPSDELPYPISLGTDIWGSKIVLIRQEVQTRVILRSFGPNQRDDEGHEDDIEEIVFWNF